MNEFDRQLGQFVMKNARFDVSNTESTTVYLRFPQTSPIWSKLVECDMQRQQQLKTECQLTQNILIIS